MQMNCLYYNVRYVGGHFTFLSGEPMEQNV